MGGLLHLIKGSCDREAEGDLPKKQGNVTVQAEQIEVLPCCLVDGEGPGAKEHTEYSSRS